MFQKEVAQRVAAKEGSKTYGILSVLVQAFYKVEYLFDVNEQCFNPPPKVKSGVIRLGFVVTVSLFYGIYFHLSENVALRISLMCIAQCKCNRNAVDTFTNYCYFLMCYQYLVPYHFSRQNHLQVIYTCIPVFHFMDLP